MNNTKKVLELGAEGGSISIFQFIDAENKDWYYYNVNEMSYEDLGLSGLNKNSEYAMSFLESMIRMLGKYPNALEFYPLFVDLENKNVLIEVIKQTIKNNDFFNYQRWAELLEIGIEELKN